MITSAGGLGRVAVVDGGEDAPRVLRAVRRLARQGRASAAVSVHTTGGCAPCCAREADEAIDGRGSFEEALRAARASSAWLGPAAEVCRAEFGETCARLGIRMIGPSAQSLRGTAMRDEPEDPEARLIEVLVARDARGTMRILGAGDASLSRGALAALVESPPPGLAAAEEAFVSEDALRACASAHWIGICALQYRFDPLRRRFTLLGRDAFAQSARAIEEASGVDAVELALLLAAGSSLDEAPALQQRYSFAGRIYSGPPLEPDVAAGPIEFLSLPSGPGVRAETAFREGDETAGSSCVLATVVTRGATRDEALRLLQHALAEGDLLLRGSGTTKAWLRALCGRPEILAGELSPGLLDRVVPQVQPQPEAALLVAAIEAYHAEQDLERARFIAEARRGRPRVGPLAGRTVDLRHLGRRHRPEVRELGPGEYRVALAGGAPAEVRLERLGRVEQQLVWQGRRYRVLAVAEGPRLLVQFDDVAHLVLRDPSGIVASPMPAVVAAIQVERGQQVALGDPLVRIESMKVEVQVMAPAAGIVREVLAPVNGQVDAGAPLLRLEPLESGEGSVDERTAEAPPPAPASPAVTTPCEVRLTALARLRQLLLGFDVTAAEAREIAAGLSALPGVDEDALREEAWALSAFGDVHSLFSRLRTDRTRPPPLEELWRYLHEPEARGAGLSPEFVTMLGRALAHYGVTLEARGCALELALLRLQKAHERADEQVPALAAILEQRLANGQSGTSRDVLDRMAQLGHERFPALADLARELRYRSFDQPVLDRVRAVVNAQAQIDLARLSAGDDPGPLAARLVECPQPLATRLLLKMGHVESARLRPLLVETLMRRYYRFRDLEPAVEFTASGFPCASVEYELRGRRYRLLTCAAAAGEAAQALHAVARLAADTPPGRDVLIELYLWRAGKHEPEDQTAAVLRAACEEARFAAPPLRVSAVLAAPDAGFGSHSQQHFTFRSGPAGFSEEIRYRGVHPMLFERLQLGRLAKFELTRLPSAVDLYLYLAVARGNPKDERLFAMGEVRDLTAVRDGNGRVTQLPELERVLHEALAGMRLFQARRALHQRLEGNRVLLTLTPPFTLSREDVERLAVRLAPATEGLGLDMVLLTARVPDPGTGQLREQLLRVISSGETVSVRWDEPTDRPLEPLDEYRQKVLQLRRRGLTHPFEVVRLLAQDGEFVEHDLDPSNALVPVQRPPGRNTANLVVGVIRNFTPLYPEGMQRVVLLGDPGREMGSVAEPECRRIEAALQLAEKLGVPLEWFEVCAGAKISMTSGTENMDWVSRVLRRLIEFTQAGGEVNVVVLGTTVGAQPYWNAEATMLMHTRGILVMTPGSTMVLTGKQALEYSGSVSAEDNEGIGGYHRVMGPNGQAHYQASSVAQAIALLLQHYDHCYVAPGERFPRRAPTSDPRDRDVRAHPHGPEGGAGFRTVGDIFSAELNPERKKPFEIRSVMGAAVDQDHAPLERWRDLRGGETAVVWDAHLGGIPVCMIGIQSRPLPRQAFVPADGPELWSAGTLFPLSSKKIARAINAASGNRPVVILANLSGFDGSPESMRRLQLEYGAEIGRAVVNFDGPIVFCVVSRYHGGAFVVFAKTLTENIEIAAIEGARASVIGGAPAAAVVFAREVEARTRKDPRVIAAENAAAAGDARKLPEIIAAVRSEKLGEVGDEYDQVHSVARALEVGSLDRIITARDLRPYLIDAVERGMSRFTLRRDGRR